MRILEVFLFAAAALLQVAAAVFAGQMMREKRGVRSWQLLFAAFLLMLVIRFVGMAGTIHMPRNGYTLFNAVLSFAVSLLLFVCLIFIKRLAYVGQVSEQVYRSIGESIDYGVWICDENGRNIYASPSFLRLVGISQEQCSAFGWGDVLHPEDSAGTLDAWQQCIRDGGPWYREHRFKGVDGQWHPILACGVAVRDKDGQIKRWAGINLDIRRLKETEERERSARTLAEQQSRMKDEFLTTLSHELRTPLNAIVGWTHILQSAGATPEDLKQGLEVIDRNAHVQATMIEDLLDVSRIITGKIRLDVQSIAPQSFIEAAIETVLPAANAKNIRIHKTLDASVGPISGDPGRMQQIVWNLLINAIKFTPRDGRIEVLLRRNDSHVEIVVTDNGEGIKPDFLPFLFQRFTQADSSASRRHTGLGLGLAIVKNITEMHGGSVRAASAGVGQGATFVISLPLRANEIAVNEPVNSQTTDAAGKSMGNPGLAGILVLVVDDDADARELIRRVLVEANARVQLASSAQEALGLVSESVPDVIISDIGMPGIDGYQFMQDLRSRGITAPAVAITAFARSEDRLRVLQAGYQMHLAKPVEPAEIAAVVASMAGRPGREMQPARAEA